MTRAFACFISILGFVSTVYAQGAIENPAPGSRQSGVGLVSGWKCSVSHLTATIDGGPPFFIPYGSARGDTQGVCGDADNGFGILINWNRFSDGTHTLRLFDGGVQFASVTFTTQSLGGEYLTGLNRSVTVSNFPAQGQTTTLQWSETAQNFLVSGFSTGGGGGSPSLSALLGQWLFSYTIISTFTNFYDLQEIDTSTGTPVILGEDEFGDPIIAARVQDLIDDPFPYDFALLDPSTLLCRFYVFNHTSTNAVSGLYFQASATSSGCGAIISDGYSMSGTRIGTGQALILSPPSEADEMQQAQLKQETQALTALSRTSALDRVVVERLMQHLQER